MKLKLDLQMFAEGDATVETTETLSFEELYHNGAPNDVGETNDTNIDDVGEDGDESGDIVDGAESETTTENTVDTNQQQPWKNQQNAQFAAQRRRQEEAQRIAQAKQAARDAVYAEQFSGTLNPYTGQPIKTEADYRAYMQAYNAEILKNAGIQQEQFNKIVENDPRIQQAQAVIAEQQQQKQQIARMKQQQELDNAVEKIKKIDKSVKTEQDIINNAHFTEIADMWKRGYSLEDAYYLANRAEMEQKKQAATRQQTINQVAGKSHMKATGQNGTGDEIIVPPDQMAMYKRFMPDASEADIKKHYARMTKKG